MSAADLPLFDPNAACAKCASGDIGATYNAPCNDGGCRIDKHQERIDRNCRRCRFVWHEAPLDSLDDGP